MIAGSKSCAKWHRTEPHPFTELYAILRNDRGEDDIERAARFAAWVIMHPDEHKTFCMIRQMEREDAIKKYFSQHHTRRCWL